MSNWREELISRYPTLFRAELPGGRTYHPGYPTVGDGWSDLIGRAVERIAAAAGPYPPTIVQISEKFGTLRLYCSYSSTTLPTPEIDAAIQDAIALAQARSACSCEICGEEGRLYSVGSWVLTACPVHARGKPVPMRPGHENLHIVRSFVDGRPGIVSCRRYDRSHDRFVDLDPLSLGIRE